MPPAVVAVQEAKARSIPVEFEYPAQTAGSREVEVRARVPGILLKRNFEEGAQVRAGQSLYQLDAAPFEAAVSRAEADIASELVDRVRTTIGAFACFRTALVVKGLPKTRSGKILRGTVKKIADGQDYTTPATIEDAGVLGEIRTRLKANQSRL